MVTLELINAKEIVTEIQSYCQSGGATKSLLIEDRAKQYSLLCREANFRLRECDELLGKGLRTESIHLADQYPPLLETVSQLQFVELPVWEKLVLQHEYEPYQPLLISMAEALGQAYREFDKLKNLFAKFRHSSLAQIPLSERLAILREIHDKDQSYSIWQDDLKQFEDARQKELKQEIQTSNNAQDDLKTLKLLRELTTYPWRNPPIMDFIEPLLKIHKNMIYRQLIKSAHEKNQSQLYEDLKEWDQLTSKSQRIDESQQHNVNKIRSWLKDIANKSEKELHYQTTLAQLEAEIETGNSVVKLRRAYDELYETNLVIPRQLKSKYQDRLSVLESSRFQVRIIIATVIFSLILLGIFWAFILKDR